MSDRSAACVRGSSRDSALPLKRRRPFTGTAESRVHSRMPWLALVAAVSLTAHPVRLSAQCPDGSPPPCAARAAANPPPNSVAVLYFDNLSPDTADAYLADGLTEELILRLGRVQRLAVKSRNAVQSFRGRAAKDPSVLGDSLRVAYLVSGNIRRGGTRLRITVELVRTAGGARVWGDAFDREDADVLALEEDIALTVTTIIAGRLLPAERAPLTTWPTRSPLAYDHFLRGNHHLAQRNPRSLLRAVEEYETAVRLDRDFTPALARIAYAYGLYLAFGESGTASPDSVLRRGLTAADRALRQDPTAADAWMARGLLLTYKDPRTFLGAREAFERSIAFDPRNAEAFHSYGGVLMTLGDDSAAAAAFHGALVLDPRRPSTLDHLALLRYVERRYDETRRWLDSAQAVDAGFFDAYGTRILLHLTLGEVAEAQRVAAALMQFGVATSVPLAAHAVLTAVNARAGDSVAARQHLDSLSRVVGTLQSPSPPQGFLVGWALMAVGDVDRTLDLLERVRPRGADLSFYLRFPEFDPVRTHPRFQHLVEESRPPGAPK